MLGRKIGRPGPTLIFKRGRRGSRLPESRRNAATALIESDDAVFAGPRGGTRSARTMPRRLTSRPRDPSHPGAADRGDALIRWMQTVTSGRRWRCAASESDSSGLHQHRDRRGCRPRPSRVDRLGESRGRTPADSREHARARRYWRHSSRKGSEHSPSRRGRLRRRDRGTTERVGYKINRCTAEGRNGFCRSRRHRAGPPLKELAGALSEMADGEGANGSIEALQFHLGRAACRATLRATGRSRVTCSS